MYSLNLPKYPLKITEKNGKHYVFDLLRRKKVVLTPEEWVRQHFVNYLLTEKNVPKELMANEVAITLNTLSRRCDTVIYDTYLKPLAIVEYKAPSVRITQDVFEQIARYNLVLRVHYLIVSNGMEHYCCRIDYATNSYTHLKAIPSYTELLGEN
ncbi:type I restriction enzyme HsdR N-terminal domain-containing protein [Tannerella sp.]|uniref:type I restriction enzyme HsdR N-terminal domain-containing protein n=1 Tax=Tannerella sp. TaxID=2382127 RepID=UPI0026DB09BD|nr:type I restriction enzyme HsdR N-terminal domain-containing protein [Tannerella sp.]MDO4702760.1 type I restriction enzyme HsdR N-terminal domain-containing protein [Tannerella sp.]